jgi:hypothetical protein
MIKYILSVVMLLSIGAAAQINSPCSDCAVTVGITDKAPEGDTPTYLELPMMNVLANDPAFSDNLNMVLNSYSYGQDSADSSSGGGSSSSSDSAEQDANAQGEVNDLASQASQGNAMRTELYHTFKPGVVAKWGGPGAYALQVVGGLMNLMCGPIGCGLIAGLDVPSGFGANDLVMGVHEHLADFQRGVGKGGGDTILSLINHDLEVGDFSRILDSGGNAVSGFKLMKNYMDETALTPRAMIRFNLDGLERGPGGEITAFNPSAPSRIWNSISSQEIRYGKSEWGTRFNDQNMAFYSWGARVPKPW